MSGGIKLLSILPSKKKDKKLTATFKTPSGNKQVHFGASSYEDYTVNHNEERRANYRARHAKDNLDDPMSPGALSYWILWGDSTSLRENIKQYKQRYGV